MGCHARHHHQRADGGQREPDAVSDCIDQLFVTGAL